jgi:hypothetical protein
MDSFDHLATADLAEKWTSTGAAGTGSVVTIGASSGRRGSGGLLWTTGTGTNVSGYVSRVLVPGDATAIVGFALNVSAAQANPNGTTIAAIRDSGGTVHVSVRVNTDLTLSAYRGLTGGTLLGTSSGALTAAAFAHVELKVLVANAGGTVDIRLNGASVLALTGQDTQNSANASWASVVLGHSELISNTNTSPGRTFAFDDLYVLDGTGAAPWNAFLGDCRVDVRVPTGAGATTGWTPNTGTNWAAVDDAAPDDDTTYTSAATAGLTDTFVVQDAPVAGAAIYGVQHCLNVKKTDAGSAAIAPVIRHSGVDYVGADFLPGTGYTYALAIDVLNPGTAAAWTEAGFNAAEFGYKRTA